MRYAGERARRWGGSGAGSDAARRGLMVEGEERREARASLTRLKSERRVVGAMGAVVGTEGEGGADASGGISGDASAAETRSPNSSREKGGARASMTAAAVVGGGKENEVGQAGPLYKSVSIK